MIKNKGLLVFIFLLLFSCKGSNLIYVDIEKQSINSCDGRVISKLFIENLNEYETYILTKQRDKKGTSEFSFVDICVDYSIESGGGGVVNSNSFRLKTNAEYRVANFSNGDIVNGELLLRTNNDGLIDSASMTSCD